MQQWRRAAVLVGIAAEPPHSIILIERAGHLRRHPGQIGLPGGLEDPADNGNPVATALRELHEELGVGCDQVTVTGALPEQRQPRSRLILTAIVGVIEAGARLTVNEEEIVEAFTAPLAQIVGGGALYEDVELSIARGKTMYALDYQGRHIWGITGQVLRSFADAWNAEESSLRYKTQAAFTRANI